jgi:exodeoxyribonuclease-3
MRIATWNVNSLKVRLEHVIEWTRLARIDALVMQETKLPDDQFPERELAAAGFDCIHLGQKAYNGVALVVRRGSCSLQGEAVYNIPGYEDEQKRLIGSRIRGSGGQSFTFIGAYFPNGQSVGSDKYLYKLDWVSALTLWLKEQIAAGEEFILAGDFNIAPRDEDVWDTHALEGGILISGPERAAWRSLIAAGLIDTWELGLHAPGTYSWWDYRGAGYQKNQGLRIDHMLATPGIARSIRDVFIDEKPRGWDKPSDHAPVVAVLG